MPGRRYAPGADSDPAGRGAPEVLAVRVLAVDRAHRAQGLAEAPADPEVRAGRDRVVGPADVLP